MRNQNCRPLARLFHNISFAANFAGDGVSVPERRIKKACQSNCGLLQLLPYDQLIRFQILGRDHQAFSTNAEDDELSTLAHYTDNQGVGNSRSVAFCRGADERYFGDTRRMQRGRCTASFGANLIRAFHNNGWANRGCWRVADIRRTTSLTRCGLAFKLAFVSAPFPQQAKPQRVRLRPLRSLCRRFRRPFRVLACIWGTESLPGA